MRCRPARALRPARPRGGARAGPRRRASPSPPRSRRRQRRAARRPTRPPPSASRCTRARGRAARRCALPRLPSMRVAQGAPRGAPCSCRSPFSPLRLVRRRPEPVEHRVHHPVRLLRHVQRFPRAAREEGPPAVQAVAQEHCSDLLGDEQHAALRAMPVVQPAQLLLLVLLEPAHLLVVQLPDPLGVLAHEVLVLQRGWLGDGHSRFPSGVAAFSGEAAGARSSIAIRARSCCGESSRVARSSFFASASWRIERYAIAIRNRIRALRGEPESAVLSFSNAFAPPSSCESNSAPWTNAMRASSALSNAARLSSRLRFSRECAAR